MKKPTYAQLARMDKSYLWHPFTQMESWEKEEILIIERGRGNYLIDVKGRRYLDGVSSLWTNVHGHGKRYIDAAIKGQLGRIAHSTFLGLSHPGAIVLSKMLLDIVPPGLERVFYSDNGATAVEIAIKMALQYWHNIGEPQRYLFVSLDNAYHGDTIGSVSVGGIGLFHSTYKPLLFETVKAPSPYCYRCGLGLEYPSCGLACARKVGDILASNEGKVAGLVIEPMIQAAGGFILSPPGYLKAIEEITKRHGVLLIADEVATGFGRTGRMFACEHEHVSPDIMTAAKGISGGYLPVAATFTTGRVYDAFLGGYGEKKTFYHGHTYTANPLGVAACIANLELFRKERVIRRLRPKIRLLKEGLGRIAALEHVGEVRQIGMMTGIELVRDRATKEPYPFEQRTGARVCFETRKHGIFIRPLDDVVVLMPPLSITERQLSYLLKSVEGAIRAVTEQR
ncbi:MAG: adenosylmethionine--8-amino-7-oxononanoate transaminase [Deltaproteobacteria bacterium]|nr:adenosylmethionine--8-amino-7-oxononanoate transaminase [Deltaproteobacteria bacterium]MCL5276287.1 adenosylmethionine--8-amino-7-oxononanoate transaminase [Deltaproteobacteria bacterium]